MRRSGFCPPYNHPTSHAECQRRQEAGEISCDCPDHGGHAHDVTSRKVT